MKTEIEIEQLKRYIQIIKFLESELYAYRELYQYVRDSRKIPAAELAQELQQLKAVGWGEMCAKYDSAIQSLADESDQRSVDQALVHFAEWLPKGRPN